MTFIDKVHVETIANSYLDTVLDPVTIASVTMIGKDPRPSEEHSRQARHYCDILLPALREVAKQCGYAIAVHGSLERDIDLVAIPWRDMEMTPEHLVKRLFGVIQAVLGPSTLDDAVEKPHGRKALTMRFCGHHYIDLSVMPPTKTEKHATEKGEA